MVRDKLAEIAGVRERALSHTWRGASTIQDLQRRWDNGRAAASLPAAFVIIRLVTALEVMTRDWVKEIIDEGSPYVERGAKLVSGSLRIDFVAAQALVGKQVTFGELIAHELSVNNIGDVDRIFSALLETPLFAHIEGLTDRYSVEMLRQPAIPFVSDARWTRSHLAQLFDLRHIHVHELPADAHIDPELITDLLDAATGFARACDEAFQTLLHGDYPLTQMEMNARAGDEAEVAERDLAAVLAELDPDQADAELKASQAAWQVYRKRQAEFRSGVNSPTRGSIAPLIYAVEKKKITLARIDELRWYLTRAEGDL